eukprot:477889-Ditylum_brightwellii.AAC.1
MSNNNIFDKVTLTSMKCTVDQSGFLGESFNFILDHLKSVTFKYELMYTTTVQHIVAAILTPIKDATIKFWVWNCGMSAEEKGEDLWWSVKKK